VGEEGGEKRDSGMDLTDLAMILESRMRASAPGLRNLWNRSSIGEEGADLGSLRPISECDRDDRERRGRREPKMRGEGKGFWGDLWREGRVRSLSEPSLKFYLLLLICGVWVRFEGSGAHGKFAGFHAFSGPGSGNFL
jgi:hypothetical protein